MDKQLHPFPKIRLSKGGRRDAGTFQKLINQNEPIFESKQLDNVYLKGLSKYSQIRLAIALELANRDLQDEEKKLKEFPN